MEWTSSKLRESVEENSDEGVHIPCSLLRGLHGLPVIGIREANANSGTI